MPAAQPQDTPLLSDPVSYPANTLSTVTNTKHDSAKPRTVQVQNMFWWTHENLLSTALTSIGVYDVLDIDFDYDPRNGMSLGSATVSVVSQASVELVANELVKLVVDANFDPSRTFTVVKPNITTTDVPKV